ncbi:MAG: hypothetical protein R3B52_01285 [Candidatus Paceibacterota bacterium]
MPIDPNDLKSPAFMRKRRRKTAARKKVLKPKKKVVAKPVKKAPKKIAAKPVKKKSAPKKALKAERPKKEENHKEIVAEVTAFFDKIKVAILKVEKPLKLGQKLQFEGGAEQLISSMQFNHEQIKVAKPGQEIGVKVAAHVQVGQKVYRV